MHQKAGKDWMKHLDFTLIDALYSQLAYVTAYFVRHELHWPYESQLYHNTVSVFLSIQIFVTFFGESFKNVLKRGYLKELISVVKYICLAVPIATFYLFATQQGEEHLKITLVMTGVLYAVFSYGAKILWKRYLLTRGDEGKGKRSLLIPTSKDMVEKAVENVRQNNYECFRVVGATLPDAGWTGQSINGVGVIVNNDFVTEYVCREWVGEIFVNFPKKMSLPQGLIDCFMDMGIAVHLKLIGMGRLKGQIQHMERLGTYTVLTSSINVASWRQAFFKRAIDTTGGIIGCVLAGLLSVMVVPYIYVQLSGPISSFQIRIRKNGGKFKLYKS